MKVSIFIRILTATLLPVMLVIFIVISTARTVIHADGVRHAKEYTMLAAKQVSEQAAVKLENTAVIQREICRELSNLDYSDEDTLRIADGLLNTLLLSNYELYSTWFAFEQGVFFENERYFKTLLRTDSGITEIYDMSDMQLDDKDKSPWYNVPLESGEIYTNVLDYYDYGLGEGFIHIFTMTYPIITPEGKTIGCVGLDIRYEDLFPITIMAGESPHCIMLLSQQGTVIYNFESCVDIRTLEECGYSDPDAVLSAMSERLVWQEEIEPDTSDVLVLSCLYPIDIFQSGQTIYLRSDVPVSTLYGSLYASMEIIIAAGVLGMILLMFSVFFTTRGIAQHVKRITESFNHVANISAEGTLEGEHIPISETNVIELDILQSALVRMIIQLRRAHEHRLQAVEAEVEKEKLIASSEAKTNFFAAMSHEIRTPMNAIIGISEIMLHEGHLSQKQEKDVRDIKMSADALLGIINDILDISKMETGKMELHPEHYNFKTMMDNIVSISSHLAAGAKLEFVFEPECELPYCLYGDSARLRQVLLNLIGNAVKFTRQGRVTLRVNIREDKLEFSVIDTGIGIRESEKEYVFEFFKRIDTRRSREVKGTGLGLAISRSLVETMGGTIELYSVYGSGSMFVVSIPFELGDESQLQQPKTRAGATFSPSLRVLIVDDDMTNLTVSSGLMRVVHGIKCDTASSGFEAIEKVQKTEYDMIFMDHMMPEMDGVDTTQHIRRLGEKFEKIPIIALTANAVIGTRKQLISGGMDDFLAKPIQSEKLAAILEKWVPESKQIDTNAMTGAVGTELGDAELSRALDAAGINKHAGMENIGCDEIMYLKSLRLLCERLAQISPLLLDLVENENMREFHVYIHGLKGSLASVGAHALSEQVREIENAALEDDVALCREKLPALCEEIGKLHEQLRAALPSVSGFEKGNAGGARVQKIGLKRLLSALESYDYDAVAREMNAVISTCGACEKNGQIAQLSRMIDSFNYSAAAVYVSELISQL